MRCCPGLRLMAVALLPALTFATAWAFRGQATAEAAPAPAGRDWPMFGGTPGRNLANEVERGLADAWDVTKGKEKNVKWSAAVGSTALGGPVVAGGRVFVGTNNDKPRDHAVKGDKGVLMCFDAADGKFLWQAVHDKLPSPDENDWPKEGVLSAPCVDGDRVYYVSNRCELVCAAAAGDPATPGKAKTLWSFDMVKELKVYPCFASNSAPLVSGDLVFAVTSNGVEPNSQPPRIPSPDAPSFVAVDKNTGKLRWSSNLPGKNIMEGQWGSPAAAEVGGVTQVIFPGGDGWLYAFEAKSGDLLWKFDCNPKASVYKPGGRGDRSYLVATPVVVGSLVYIGTGVNPDEASGSVGHLWCVDASKKPANKDRDLSPVGDNFDPKAPANKDSGLAWHFGGKVVPKPADGDRDAVFGRTISTVAVHDGLLYVADVDGFFYCLDAKTGKKYWEHDLKDATWCSPYYVDGRVLIGTDGGDLVLFAHGKEKKELGKINMDQALKVPPVAAGGVLYINNGTNLFAVAPK